MTTGAVAHTVSVVSMSAGQPVPGTPDPTVRVAGRVLVVDDDPNLAEVVARYLQKEGLTVEIARDGRTGLEMALATLPDLVVLDLMLPGLDGIEVFRRLRKVAPIPVVMLTARGSEEERVAGLDLGADDYVAKPFSPRELVARVKAVLRRAGGGMTANGASSMARLSSGDLELDRVSHEVTRAGAPLALTVKEFDLLAHLMSSPGVAWTREQLLEAVWGYTIGDTATVTVHVRRLREKIEPDPSVPTRLATVRGIGYRWELG
jgi:DNA-binding response OmpR family regulator